MLWRGKLTVTGLTGFPLAVAYLTTKRYGRDYKSGYQLKAGQFKAVRAELVEPGTSHPKAKLGLGAPKRNANPQLGKVICGGIVSDFRGQFISVLVD